MPSNPNTTKMTAAEAVDFLNVWREAELKKATPKKPGRWFVDTFESGLRTRDHGNSDLVLHEVRTGGRFSTFEMTAGLQRTLNRLVAGGEIEELPSEYPWLTYQVKDQTQ